MSVGVSPACVPVQRVYAGAHRGQQLDSMTAVTIMNHHVGTRIELRSFGKVAIVVNHWVYNLHEAYMCVYV